MTPEILLVGNARAIEGCGLGPRIDSYDRVLRFNEFVVGGDYAADYGTRVTHHACILERAECLGSHCYNLLCTAPHNYPPELGRLDGVYMQAGGDYGFLLPRTFVIEAARAADLPEGRHASTGLVMVEWFRTSGFRPILVNFDGFETTHYYPGWSEWDQRGVDQFHAPKAELRYFAQLAQQGAIGLLAD